MANYILGFTLSVQGAYLSSPLPSTYTDASYDGSVGEFVCYVMTGATASAVNSKMSGSSTADYVTTVHRGSNFLCFSYTSTSVYARCAVTWFGQTTAYSTATQLKTGMTATMSVALTPLSGFNTQRLILNSYANYFYNYGTSMTFGKGHSGQTGTTGAYFSTSSITSTNNKIQVIDSDGISQPQSSYEEIFPQLGWMRPMVWENYIWKVHPGYAVTTTNAVVTIKNNLSVTFQMMYFYIRANYNGGSNSDVLYVIGNPTISPGATVTCSLQYKGAYYNKTGLVIHANGYIQGSTTFTVNVVQSPMVSGAMNFSFGSFTGTINSDYIFTLITDLTVNTLNITINQA